MLDSPPIPPFTQPRVRALVLYFFIFSLLIGMAMGGFQGVVSANLADPLWAIVIYIVLFVTLSLWLLQQFKRYEIQPLLVWGRKPDHPRWLATGGLVMAALVFSLSSFLVAASVLSYVVPDFVEAVLREVEADATSQTSNGLLYQIVTAIATIIVAPITEEFIFRGFILQRWGVKWNLPFALIVSSVGFGLLHLNPIGLSVFGLVMGLLYIKTRSLFVPVAAHMLNNIIATVMTYLPTESEPTTIEKLHANLPLGILLLAISAPWLVRFIAKNFPRRDAPIPYVINAQKFEGQAQL